MNARPRLDVPATLSVTVRARARARVATALLAIAVALATLADAACDDGGPPDQPCTGIPDGGCPLSHGVACEDPLCEAAYACLPGNVWKLDHVCPAHEGGARDGSSSDGGADASAQPVDASVDAPPGAYGGPGCGPLQIPDCSVGFALACPPGSGCCDCEDLFVCDDGWTFWGVCTLDGGVQPR
jgi:hypothetical protein